jgi:hypothetical protein
MQRAIAFIAAAAALAAAVPAEARSHGHVRSVQGPFGHGYVQSRSVARQPGSASVTRSLQTNSGRGYVSNRSRSSADGVYTGGRTTELNNGKSFGRSTTATANGDGTADYTTTFTGPNGGSASRSGTVGRP